MTDKMHANCNSNLTMTIPYSFISGVIPYSWSTWRTAAYTHTLLSKCRYEHSSRRHIIKHDWQLNEKQVPWGTTPPFYQSPLFSVTSLTCLHADTHNTHTHGLYWSQINHRDECMHMLADRSLLKYVVLNFSVITKSHDNSSVIVLQGA